MGARIRIVDHDPAWSAAFEAEARRLQGALGAVAAAVHHVGSTSVPGLVAKPVIDVLLEVERLAELDVRTPVLEGLGYEALGEYGIPGRRYFRRGDAAGVRTHQVHAFARGSHGALRHLAFRDYLLAHPDEARAYGELKRRLARDHDGDPEAYMDGKDPWISACEVRALAWRSGVS